MPSKRVRVKRALALTRYFFDSQLFWGKIFGHVIPISREKNFPKVKILRHFERHDAV